MGTGATLVSRCSAHKDLSRSKVRMGQAHRARVWPEPAGSRVRKDIRSGSEITGFSLPIGTTSQEARAYHEYRRWDKMMFNQPK